MTTDHADLMRKVEGTGFKSNGVADAVRAQIGEPRRFKPKPCAVCDQMIDEPRSGAQKYHDDCKPKAGAQSNGNGNGAQAARKGTSASTRTRKPRGTSAKKRTRTNGNGRAAATPAPTGLLATLTAECDQELGRIDGELERIEKGIEAMRAEQNRLKDQRVHVARARKALAG